MVGERRYNYSVDIGKDLEKSRESADSRELENARERSSSEELKRKEEELKKSEIREQPSETSDDEPEEMPEEPKKPDPFEEDINELITKETPQLPQKKGFFERAAVYTIPFCILLIVVFGWWSLTRTANLRVLETYSEKAVERQIQLEIAQQINAEWSLLSQKEKARKATQQYVQVRDTPEINEQIEKLAAMLQTQYTSSEGMPYLYGNEPYSYAVLLTKPDLVPATSEVQKKFAAFIAVIKSLTGTSVEKLLFYIPVWLGIIVAVLLFFSVRFISTITGLLASLLLLLHPEFLKYFSAGFPDITGFTILLFLIVFFFLSAGIHTKGSKRIIFLVIALAVTLYSFGFLRDVVSPASTSFIEQLGSWSFVIIGIIGILFGLKDFFAQKKHYNKWLFLELLIGVFGGIFSSLFVLVIPMICILVAIAIDRVSGLLQRFVTWFNESPQESHRIISRSVGVLLLFGLVWATVPAPVATLPVMNDEIVQAGKFISSNASTDAVLVVPPGQDAIWAFAAKQRVFDPLQNPLLAKFLAANDEKQALGILKELVCKNESTCNLPVNVVVSEESLAQLPRLAAFAENPDDVDFNNDLVSAPVQCVQKEDRLRCKNGLIINITSLDARSDGKHPSKFYLYESKGKQIKQFDDASSPFAVVVLHENNEWRSFLVNQELADTMLVRLFGNDPTLHYFEQKLVVQEPERLATFSVMWSGRNIYQQY